jgi:hypothetical protein
MRLRWPAPILWFVKLFACALSPFLMLVGLLTLVAGLAAGSIITSCIGVYDILIYGIHIYKVSRPPASPGSFEQAFGVGWKEKIPGTQKTRFLSRRFQFILPSVPSPNRIFPLQAYLAQTGSFCVIPGSRHLVSHPLAWLLFTCMAALFTFLTRIFKQDLSLPTWQHRDM